MLGGARRKETRRDLVVVGRLFVALGLLIAALVGFGCGGGDGGGSSGALASATTPEGAKPAEGGAVSERTSQPAPKHGAAKRSTPERKATHRDAATVGTAAPLHSSKPRPHHKRAAPVGQQVSSSGGGGSRAGHGNGGSNHSGSHHGAKHHPQNPSSGSSSPAGIPGLPSPDPGTLGEANYAQSRSLCSDPMVLDLVPKAMQSDPEALASLYASYIRPQDRQAAYAGCLAGLHDLGL